MNKFMLIFALLPLVALSSNGRGRSNTVGSDSGKRSAQVVVRNRAQSQQPRGGHDFRVAARAVMAAETIARQSRSADYITTASAASEPICILPSELDSRLSNPVFSGVDVGAIRTELLTDKDFLYPKTLLAAIKDRVSRNKLKDALAVLAGPDFGKVMAAPSIASFFFQAHLANSSRNMTADAINFADREASRRKEEAASSSSRPSYADSSPDTRRAMLEKVKVVYRADQTPSPRP